MRAGATRFSVSILRIERFMKYRIPIMRPRAVRPELLLPRIQSISSSGIFSNHGPQVVELERRAADLLDVAPELVVATSNATVGLSAAIASSELKDWLLPGWTFPATPLAALNAGARIRFADISPESWYVRDTRKTSSEGIVNVIPFGGSFDEEAWAYAGPVVIDAAASLATKLPSLKNLPTQHSIVFSLHATKTMGGAEGGIAVFGSLDQAHYARQWINFGFGKNRESSMVGVNGKISEYDAAVANARWDGWEEERLEWTELRHTVEEQSKKLKLAEVPSALKTTNPYWVVTFDSAEQRDSVKKTLRDASIDSRLWWGAGLHQMPAFKQVRKDSLPAIEDIASRYLGLPYFLGLGEEEITEIVNHIAREL